METATQELIYQLIILVITGVLTILGAYLKKLIKTKIDVTKYGFENGRVERILDNAISYAESYGDKLAKTQAKAISGMEKLSYAKGYINKIDPALVRKYGDQLEIMISRKVAQKFGK